MIKRYLRIIKGGIVFAKDDITKQDLVDVKNYSIDALVDIIAGKYYDADENEWKEIL